jgi:hypothetical protein
MLDFQKDALGLVVANRLEHIGSEPSFAICSLIFVSSSITEMFADLNQKVKKFASSNTVTAQTDANLANFLTALPNNAEDSKV